MIEERRCLPLHTRVLIGLVIGLVSGIIVQAVYGAEHEGVQNFVKNYAYPVGQVFLRMIFMIVVPLLFAALVLGVMEIGDAKRVGRVGIRALVLTIVLSSIAVLIGLFAVNTFKPGAGIPDEKRQTLIATYSNNEAAQKTIEQSGSISRFPTSASTSSNPPSPASAAAASAQNSRPITDAASASARSESAR